MAYPIQWLDATFNSRKKAEDLLRPDLESGLISQHDYHLATTFLPGYHRYWPYSYAVLGSGGAAVYGMYGRRPRLSFNRTTAIATVAGFFGAVYGQFRRAKAHWTFTNLLKDPVSFHQALENVNQRTGGVRPLSWTLQRAKEIAQKEDMHGNVPRPADDPWVSDGDQTAAPAPNTQAAPPSLNNAPKATSRWDEIRAANARNAGQSSSWDVLRQSHERERVQTNAPADAPSSPETGRAAEQAQFDALLETERRTASR
ncbi:hypothetical protein AcW1_000741 [Taiwanofungus camphoratus]|nr:hypothetical protein AcW2_000757 [Antrodia cinnamomea]KAI0961742.1 hypothetical protein AcV7_000761 [Antrodia cinnamomea]KAI0963752.1 hypothetical protein AcW1_000741 [Antrodia cinnamomea]